MKIKIKNQVPSYYKQKQGKTKRQAAAVASAAAGACVCNFSGALGLASYAASLSQAHVARLARPDFF